MSTARKSTPPVHPANLLLFVTVFLSLLSIVGLARAVCSNLRPSLHWLVFVLSALPLLGTFACTQLFNERFIHENHRLNLLERNFYWVNDRAYVLGSHSLLVNLQMRYTYLVLGKTRGQSVQRLTMSSAVILLTIPVITLVIFWMNGLTPWDLFAPLSYVSPELLPSGISAAPLEPLWPYLVTAWLASLILGIVVAIGYAPTLWYWHEALRQSQQS